MFQYLKIVKLSIDWKLIIENLLTYGYYRQKVARIESGAPHNSAVGRMAGGDGTCRRISRERYEGSGISSWQSAARCDRKTLRQRGALDGGRRACHLAFVPQGAQGEEDRGDRPAGSEIGESGAGRCARV